MKFLVTHGNLTAEEARRIVSGAFAEGKRIAIKVHGEQGSIRYRVFSYLNPLEFFEVNRDRGNIFVEAEVEYHPHPTNNRYMDAIVTVTLGLDTGY